MRDRLMVIIVLVFLSLLAIFTTSADPANTPKTDQAKIGWFKLELGGVTVATFTSVEGLESKTDVIQSQQGGDPTSHKVPGKTSYSNIRLRGESLSADLWQWRKKAVLGATDLRKSGAIIFVAQDGTQLARYNFTNAWPAGWMAGKTTDGRMFEEIELAVEGWEKQYP